MAVSAFCLAAVVTACAAVLPHTAGAAEAPSACIASSEEHGPGEESCLLQAPRRRLKSGRGEPGEEPLKILFVGNSFTYGPAEYNSTIQINLPRLFKLVAESLGRKVQQEEDTIGGCSVYMHRPSVNPQGRVCHALEEHCRVANTSHISPTDGCTIDAAIDYWPDNAPCPQRLAQQDYGAWDVVVLQDHSGLPTVVPALREMLAPSVTEYARVLRQSGTHEEHRFDGPIVAAFMTWSYYAGTNRPCPGDGGNPACYPGGTLDHFTDCKANNTWYDALATHPCQAYSLARGYSELLDYGAKVVVPSGLAWEAARGSEPIPEDCKAAIDAQFPDAGPLANLDLPLKPKNESLALFRGTKAHDLFRFCGPDYNSSYCDDGCHHDHHPSVIGQYLNALVFYATLFKESPIGADWPQGQTVDGLVMPTIDEEMAKALQQIAHEVVMPHLDTWWSGSSTPRRAAQEVPWQTFGGFDRMRQAGERESRGLQREKPSDSHDI